MERIKKTNKSISHLDVSIYDYSREDFANIPKKLIYEVLKTKVYLVDGVYVRDKIFVDFIAGHHIVDPYIPVGELWIDEAIPKEEWVYYIFHELVEMLLMNELKWNYDKAHGVISEIEKCARIIKRMSYEK